MTKKDETLFKFPCEYPIKIIGKAHADFEELIVTVVRKHAPDLNAAAITSKASKDDTYIAITATFTATSKEQLDKLYAELTAIEEIMFVL